MEENTETRYSCPRIETCKITRENPLEFQYRCHDKLLASICVGNNDDLSRLNSDGEKY